MNRKTNIMKKGDIVICIDDSINPKVNMDLFPNWIKKGQTYSIRVVDQPVKSRERVLLNEVTNPLKTFAETGELIEPGFSSKRFVLKEEKYFEAIDKSTLLSCYNEIIVESFIPEKSNSRAGDPRIRPIPGQIFEPELYVSCSRELSYDYPVGTRFKIKAKLNQRKDGSYYVYSPYSWKYNVLD